MRDILRSSLGRSLRELSALDRLSAAWPVACGSVLASRAEIISLDEDNVLHVAVKSGEWMQPFLQMQGVLASDLGRIARVPLSGIHFEVKRPPHSQVPPQNPPQGNRHE